jgi:hypothetical protein
MQKLISVPIESGHGSSKRRVFKSELQCRPVPKKRASRLLGPLLCLLSRLIFKTSQVHDLHISVKL